MAEQSSTQQIWTRESLFDFFHEQVGVAVTNQGHPVSTEGVYYLSNLLVERRRAADAPTGETLVDLHLRARQGGRAEAIQAYRELGDQALYTTGFFRRSLSRKSVGVSYYQGMGAAAYAQLAGLLGPTRGGLIGVSQGLDAIFRELARTFAACSEILREVRDALRAQVARTSASAVLELYEQWLETGSPRAAERLRDLGVVPARPGLVGPDGTPC